MIKRTSWLILSSLLALALPISPAHAQSARTFVSAFGNDANDCSRSTPCRTFQAAHDKTFPDGEITVLDTGGYGAVTIGKSISIVSQGAEATILVSGGVTGITVNAGAASYINLRGITIQGIGFGGGTGLRFNTGFALTITNCVVRNHTGDGIVFFPFTNANLAVSATLVADNGGNGIHIVSTGTGAVNAALNRVEAYNNSQAGIFMDSGTTLSATVAESVAANNGGDGFSALAFATVAEVMVTRSVAVNNRKNGILANGTGAVVLVGSSVMTRNSVGAMATGGGQVFSYGDNNIDRNTSSDGAPTIIAKK